MRRPIIISRRRFTAWLSGLAALPFFAWWKGARSAPSPAPLTRIAFGSCADQSLPQPIWDAVLRARPELFIFMGDNVYGDVSAAALTELREAYRVAEAIPQLRTLRETVPHLATWDDHDYGVNDGGGDFPYKRQSQALFVETWKLPADDPRRTREGLYHAEAFGPPGQRVQVILLDPRYFRSPLKQTDQRGAPGKERYVPDDDPAKTMLGEAQWQWLEQQLRVPADLRLVVSSIQFLAEGHGWERWGNLPRERRRLIDLIAATKANGVVFLSGDRHLSALYEEATGVPYRLVEITSSSLNRPYRNAREAGPNRIGDLYWPENFGTAEIDWQARNVVLTIHGIDGAPQRQVSVAIGELQPR
jgi:alkaline phosphatase D